MIGLKAWFKALNKRSHVPNPGSAPICRGKWLFRFTPAHNTSVFYVSVSLSCATLAALCKVANQKHGSCSSLYVLLLFSPFAIIPGNAKLSPHTDFILCIIGKYPFYNEIFINFFFLCLNNKLYFIFIVCYYKHYININILQSC